MNDGYGDDGGKVQKEHPASAPHGSAGSAEYLRGLDEADELDPAKRLPGLPMQHAFAAVQDHGGEHKVFATGAKREVLPGKGRYDLIPPTPIHRLAVHYENGAKKYDARNWEKGLPLSQFLDCAERHLNKFKRGMRDEDHLAAVLWNISGYIETERRIQEGKLPETLRDVPWPDSTG
jgi:hypothetical protein